MAGADLRVRLVIEPRVDNRGYILRLQGDSYEWSSERDLDAEDAPRTITTYIRNVPGGNYMLSAHLITSSGTLSATPLSVELR